MTDTAASPIINTRGYPIPGDILKVIGSSDDIDPWSYRLYHVEGEEAIRNASEGIYHHKIVTDTYKPIATGDHLMVMHFFAGPQLIRYIPHSKDYGTNILSAEVPEGYVAYVLCDEQIWSTSFFKSYEDFTKVFCVVSGVKDVCLA